MGNQDNSDLECGQRSFDLGFKLWSCLSPIVKVNPPPVAPKTASGLSSLLNRMTKVHAHARTDQ